MGNKEKKSGKILSSIYNHMNFIIKAVLLIVLVIFLLWNWDQTAVQINRLFSVLAPFILAIFIAYLIMPLMDIINKGINKLIFKGKAKKVRKFISILLAYVIVLGIISITLVFIIPQLISSIKEIDIKKMYEWFLNILKEAEKNIPFFNADFIANKIQKQEDSLVNYGKNVAIDIFPVVFSFSKSLFTILFDILLSLVISLYIILDKQNLLYHFKRLIYAITPKETSPKVWQTMKECNHIFNGFLIGKTLDSFIIGIICFVVLTIGQFPYALLISVIVGITNMIPYFGPFIGAIPGVLLYAIVDIKTALIFAVIILALQQFDGLYLGPKILGDLTGLKPLWVIFAITVGGAYFGVIGMFLGVPVVAVISYLLNKFIQKKIKEKNIEELK